jgi:hypothetical protein
MRAQPVYYWIFAILAIPGAKFNNMRAQPAYYWILAILAKNE